MIFSDQNMRVWLCTRPTDMRKSFRGLISLVKNQLAEEPLSGQLFVFINRRKSYMKILYYAQGGFCIWSKRLTRGQFGVNDKGEIKQPMNWSELQWLIDGIEVEKVRYHKRHHYVPQAMCRDRMTP
jgi:transposase